MLIVISLFRLFFSPADDNIIGDLSSDSSDSSDDDEMTEVPQRE